MAAFEVPVPGNRGAEVDGARTEKVNPVLDCVFGGGRDARAVAGACGLIGFPIHWFDMEGNWHFAQPRSQAVQVLPAQLAEQVVFAQRPGTP